MRTAARSARPQSRLNPAIRLHSRRRHDPDTPIMAGQQARAQRQV